MEIIVKINRPSVYDEVAKLTAYLGAKTQIEGQPSTYKQVFTTPEDRELLSRFLRQSIDELIEVARQFYATQMDDETQCEVFLRVPADFDIFQEVAISHRAEDYCINRIASKWLAIAAPAQAEIYANEAAEALLAYKRGIYSRRIPKR